jgi:hypothetical protein
MGILSKQRMERQKTDSGLVISHCWNGAYSGPQSSSPEPVSNIQSQMTLQKWKTISKPA